MTAKKKQITEAPVDESPTVYTEVPAMEPMLPSSGRSRLAELTCEIFRKAGQLSAQVPAPVNCRQIALLIREMNSYYSNLIEGHKTLPQDIERALREDYSDNATKRANQHLALAHIQVEELMTGRIKDSPDTPIHSSEFLCWLHYEFYSRIPKELHISKTRKGVEYQIIPGELRTFEVEVGRHQPPHYGTLSSLLERFSSFYSNPQILPTNQLIALAAAHHRLAWIHPFGDGNGRVVRLFSHAWLMRCKVDGLGLWTLSRGLARKREDYYNTLARADAPRRNDYDGRGNLSDKSLFEFCDFFLQLILDQIEFMMDRLQLHNLSTRIELYLKLELIHLESLQRERLARLLKAALYEGEIERGKVAGILCLGGTVARGVIRLALKENLLRSPSEKGPLSLVFSSKTLTYYFPELFQNL